MKRITPQDALAHFTALKNAFVYAFGSPGGNMALDDLSLYCSEKRTCFHTNDAMRNVLEGRRQVILHIREYLDFTPEQLVALNSKPLNGDKADG